MRTRLWTIQPLETWELLNKQGFLMCSREFVNSEYIEAYSWMAQKMIERIGVPDIEDQLPLWAWHQHFDINQKKPDLRRSGHLPRGKQGVRIEFFKDEKEILLSDFELWHQPLFYKGYIGESEFESLEFDRLIEDSGLTNIKFNNYPVGIKQQIIKSWDKIFDLDFNDNYYTSHRNEKMIQTCFWKLELSEINSIDKFIAK